MAMAWVLRFEVLSEKFRNYGREDVRNFLFWHSSVRWEFLSRHFYVRLGLFEGAAPSFERYFALDSIEFGVRTKNILSALFTQFRFPNRIITSVFSDIRSK